MYIKNKWFEWDSQKAKNNAIKHGVRFIFATFSFDDPFAFIIEDEKHSNLEPRYWLIGDSETGVLVVVFTIRDDDVIRIISARKASRKERVMYEQSKRI
jgi:hypothetical protein